MRQFFSVLLVVTAGLYGLVLATDRFQAFTTEGARRLAVAQAPRPLPDILLEDAQGRRFFLSALRGQTLVVDFFYAGCDTLCVVVGGALSTLQTQTASLGAARPLLLSITFDPHDDLGRLAGYARRRRADDTHWRFARPVNEGDLPRLLDAFGITVIPAPGGGFEHNAALHVVNREGRLAHVADYDKPGDVLAFLERNP